MKLNLPLTVLRACGLAAGRALRSSALLSVVGLLLTASAFADTVKLRAFEFRVVAVTVAGSDGKPVALELRYADFLRQVLLSPSPQGASTDDIVRAIEVWTPIKRAIEAKQRRALLSDAEYRHVLDKLNAFRWSPRPELAEPVADFIGYVRGLKEEEFAAQEKSP